MDRVRLEEPLPKGVALEIQSGVAVALALQAMAVTIA
jgi:hypothetical protein